MNNLTIKQMTISSMLAALCTILGYLAVEIGNFKFSFEGLPILVAALAYGPTYGILVGGIGTFIYQILRYGISITTLLWVTPFVIQGFICGQYAKKHKYKNNNSQLLFIIVLTSLLVTILNTGVIYIDSKIYGYYSFAYVFGLLPMKIVMAFFKGIIYGIYMPIILKNISRITHTESVRCL